MGDILTKKKKFSNIWPLASMLHGSHLPTLEGLKAELGEKRSHKLDWRYIK